MRLLIKVKSLSDVITNSSSEVFVIKAKKPTDEVIEIIEKYAKEHTWCGRYNLDNVPEGIKHLLTDELIEAIKKNTDGSSGDGGDIVFATWEDGYKYFHGTPEEYSKKIGIPLEELKSYICVYIDWSRKATINFIKESFNAYAEDDEINGEHAYVIYEKVKYGYYSESI